MHVTPPAGISHGHHAVVIGASISGLLAARVLSPHFDRVTLLDRDRLPDAIETRSGVPQGRHGHGLLASGLQGLKQLFPSLERELRDAGAVPGDVVGSVRWYQHGHSKAKFRSGLDGLLLSRPLLEGTLRRQVARIPNVTIHAGTHVLGPLSRGGVVTGVRIERGGLGAESLTADLVVDASGRGSRSGAWLEELGFERPAVEEVRVDLGYTTRMFRRRPADLDGDVGAIVAPKPPNEMRAGFILATEGDRWIATLGGWLGHHAPTDVEGYMAFARSLSRPDIYDVIKDAEPLTEPTKYVFPSNLRRRYEQLSKFPGHYLVMGDAICSFNPLYGQGMSVAVQEALALADSLLDATPVDRLWRPFFKTVGHIVAIPWTIAVGGDFAFEGVTGPRPAGTSAVNWYMNYLHRAASTDHHVCRAFFDVANLLRPPTTLFHPSIVARVARQCMFPSRAAQAGPVAAVSGNGAGRRAESV